MIRINVGGKTRIIRDVKVDTESEFEAYYKGYHIVITEMGEREWFDEKYDDKRNSLTVSGLDGCLIVDTWEYEHDKDRQALLKEALENILSV
jgi:hypothetical protein